MNVSPMKVLSPRTLCSADGIILAVELFGVIGAFAATALLVVLLYLNPSAGTLWLALPISLALLIGSIYKARLDWKRTADVGRDGESGPQTEGSPAS